MSEASHLQSGRLAASLSSPGQFKLNNWVLGKEVRTSIVCHAAQCLRGEVKGCNVCVLGTHWLLFLRPSLCG